MLNELRTTAESTLARAEATRAAGTEAVKSSLERLERLRAKVKPVSDHPSDARRLAIKNALVQVVTEAGLERLSFEQLVSSDTIALPFRP